MKKITIGVLAHVDAGKTTLSEGLLYRAGAIRTLGRVDHRDAFLDTEALERARGITIFSKQALLTAGNTRITLLDTPGHVDFSAEMERTLQVLDYALLVVSGTDGVQAHTETLWQLLRRYRIPTFLFVTKLDLPGPGREAILQELRSRLSEDCADAMLPSFHEEAALRDEALLGRFLERGALADSELSELIRSRRLFPCYFGSGLKLDGIDALLEGLDRLTVPPDCGPTFGAKVYKILRDSQGNRMTCLKLTGGSLSVRTQISYQTDDGAPLSEKVTSLRLYSGARFESVQEAEAGTVCAVLGLTGTYPGQGLGEETSSAAPVLTPVMTYGLTPPDGCDPRELLQKLRELEEEDPLLHLVWDPRLREIQLHLMGEIQIEVLRSLILSRFDADVRITDGRILYKETIAAPVEGVGHFEPLRHYAEAHLLLEPLPLGAGLQFGSCCGEDVLDRNWQRLILTHLQERQHLGVLTGSPITDMKLTLVSGRAHLKHTEGGDFRQATYRAVRQGLMQAKSILLEPVFSFRLEVPQAQIGRAIQDLRARQSAMSAPESVGDSAVLEGVAPVATLRGYQRELTAYTGGRGRLACRVSGYAPCHNQEEVVAACQYDPESDLEHTPDSVFCAHGAGFSVKWNQVPQYMHLESCLRQRRTDAPPRVRTQNLNLEEKELQAILEREFGPIRRAQYRSPAPRQTAKPSAYTPRKSVLIVDGYNAVFAWDGLRALAAYDLDAARTALMDILCNYRAFVGCDLILVFDAYRVRDGRGEKFDHRGVQVVFTKENETGDQYIERLSHEIGKNDAVKVVTSDGLIQLSALRAGVLRMSISEFQEDVERVCRQIGAYTREKV
ncbi:MAG: translation factor GTPase family protein [Oscillospiraceae bacterium]|nr:translation factor GTPase family protein [Oscillospiraceae bacterium]